MKKCIAVLLALAVIVGLSACKTPTQQNPAEPTQEKDEAVSTEATAAPTAAPTGIVTEAASKVATDVIATENTEITAAPTEAPTAVATEANTQLPAETPTEATAADPTETPPTAEPTEMPTEDTTPHSELYVPGISQDKMVTYFNEVVLGMEYTEGDGDATVVQKWEQPISYRIDGVPNHKDAQIISALSKQLNTVEGFPGIRAATGLEQNVTISFLHKEEFDTQFAHILNGEPADGAAQFWYYNQTNDIYSGRIGYNKDAAQEIRNSVIPEELVNLLGISDTTLREDSITYQNASTATEPSAVDWAIIKLLYNPKIHCGMTAAECETIIRELYY